MIDTLYSYIQFMCQGSNTLHSVIYHPYIYGESAKRGLPDTIKSYKKWAGYDLLGKYDLPYEAPNPLILLGKLFAAVSFPGCGFHFIGESALHRKTSLTPIYRHLFRTKQ